MRRFADSKQIAVVGAGVSGLVAAAELCRAGHHSHVFEAAADHPNGKGRFPRKATALGGRVAVPL